MPQFDTISFLSDYGRKDEFVGVVHSVIRSIAPHAAVVDISHDIPRHDLRAGSLALVRAVQYLCPGVLLAVVDPGVGSKRRAIAVEVVAGDERAYFVGPDNGLLAGAVMMVGGASRCVELVNEKYQIPTPSPLFAGRDIFAPVAAHLCNGVDLLDLGTPIDPNSLLPGIVPLPQVEGSKISCEVLWVDGFGNVQLNIGVDELPPSVESVTVRHGEQVRRARRVTAFSDLKGGELGITIDSYGMAALVLDRMAASEMLGLHEGNGIEIETS